MQHEQNALICEIVIFSVAHTDIGTVARPSSNQIKSNLLMQKGQLATNNAKNQDNIKVIKTVLQSE